MFVDSKCLGWFWCLLVAGVLLCFVAPCAYCGSSNFMQPKSRPTTSLNAMCRLSSWFLWSFFSDEASTTCQNPSAISINPQQKSLVEEAKNFECGLQGHREDGEVLQSSVSRAKHSMEKHLDRSSLNGGFQACPLWGKIHQNSCVWATFHSWCWPLTDGSSQFLDWQRVLSKFPLIFTPLIFLPHWFQNSVVFRSFLPHWFSPLNEPWCC